MSDGAPSSVFGSRPSMGESLLFPISPASGETILGYIARALEPNHLGAMGQFLAMGGINLSIKGDFLSRLAGALPVLADLLCTDVETLNRLWGTEPLSIDGKRRLGGVFLRPHMVCQNTRRLPPGAAAIEHDQSTWMVRHLNFCPSSWSVLIDRCSIRGCGRELTWPSTVSLNHCGRCGASLSLQRPQAVPSLDRAALRWVLALFNDDEEVVAGAINQVPAFFDIGSATDVYELTVAFAQAAFVERQDQSGKKVDWSPGDLAKGARIILEYPRSIWDLYQNQRNREQPAVLRHAIRIARDNSHPAVIRNIEQLILQNRRARSEGRWRPPGLVNALTLTHAGNQLSAPPSKVLELVRAGHLEAVDSTLRKDLVRVPRDSVERLSRCIAGSVARKKFKVAFSIPEAAIEQLLALGWLAPEQEPSVVMLRGSHMLAGASAQALFDELRGMGTANAGLDYIPLQAAFRGVGGREKPWGAVLIAAIRQKLPGGLQLRSGQEPHLAVHENTARAIIMGGPEAASPYRFDVHQYGEFKRDWMAPHEVETYLNCTAQDVSWLRQQNYLEVLKSEKPRYSRALVEKIGLRLMTSREAAARLGISPKNIYQATAFRPEIRAIGRGFYERDALEIVLREEAPKPGWWN